MTAIINSIFADPKGITALINHIVNRSGAVFSELGDTDSSANKRYNDDVINYARRTTAFKILEAVAKNPSHPYWPTLADNVELEYGARIPPYFGEMGTPKVQPYVNGPWMTAQPVGEDQIESYVNDIGGSFSDVYGTGAVPQNQLTSDLIFPGVGLKYSTENGIIKFTGSSVSLPMIRYPDSPDDYVDQNMPTSLIQLNVKLALPLLVKEGDNLYRTAVLLGQMGENELLEVKGGATQAKPIDIQKAIQLAQKLS